MLGIEGAIVLGHFCEKHGPSIVYSTRLVSSKTPLYSFPKSSRRHVARPVAKKQHYVDADDESGSSACVGEEEEEDADDIMHERKDLSLYSSSGYSSSSSSSDSSSDSNASLSSSSAYMTPWANSSALSIPKRASKSRNSVTQVDPFASVACVHRYISIEENDDHKSKKKKKAKKGQEKGKTKTKSMSAVSSSIVDDDDDDDDDLMLTSPRRSARERGRRRIAVTMKSPSPTRQKGDEQGNKDGDGDDNNDDNDDDGDDEEARRRRERAAQAKLRKRRREQRADERPTVSLNACPSCGSMSEGQGYYSYDGASSTYVISTRYPEPSLYSAIRRTCVRSLSCEQVPGREGSVVFEEDSTACFAYVFKIKDAKARGYQRFYSLIFLLPDLSQLLTAHPFLESSFRLLVQDLKARADNKFRTEYSDAEAEASRHFGGFHPTSAGLFRRRAAMHSLRSLVELVALDDLYVRLHQHFAKMLFGAYALLNEKSLEFSAPASSVLQLRAHHQRCGDNDDGDNNDDDDDADDDEDRKEDEAAQCLMQLKLVADVLGLDVLAALVYHCVVGNQVVVACDSDSDETRWHANALLSACALILPPACRSVARNASDYMERWQCNLLGLCNGGDGAIPDHVDPSSFAMVHVLDNGAMRLYTGPDEYHHQPPAYVETTLGAQLVRIVVAQQPNAAIRLAQVRVTVEQWLNKAKVFFRLAKSVEDDADTRIDQFTRALGLKPCDLRVLRFLATGMKQPLLLNHFLWHKIVH
jgi:Vesicle coat protein involved in Golgi to plasma membrane transport/Folliculin C-terminal domain